ncbi:hemin uptake protein HemP [Escherichia alba]|uniref:Hemin uptake protein HemP n=1 Tax=Intestinirhabdus alba TaxID=2899544 RepID=A0A6L6IMI6_9ENTR|nr:hemin uptake protein HemP [Intestinirhabdus alba]
MDSQALPGNEGKVIIDRHGHQYLLRQTQAGKLLLIK